MSDPKEYPAFKEALEYFKNIEATAVPTDKKTLNLEYIETRTLSEKNQLSKLLILNHLILGLHQKLDNLKISEKSISEDR